MGLGDNAFGQLGDSTTTDRKTPTQVPLASIVAIAAGEFHSVALHSNGDVYTWGRNTNGQLGTGTTTPSSTPVLITGAVSSVGAGLTHTLIVKNDGTVWATGANGNGQLGDGSTTQRPSPVQMTGVANAVRASGGSRLTVVLLASGTLMAAGYNGFGQVGDGTTAQRPSAVAVGSLSNVAAIATGSDHTLAITASGQVWAWGHNTDGQVGDGTTTARNVPTLVPNLASIESVGCGFFHSMAITSSGAVYTGPQRERAARRRNDGRSLRSRSNQRRRLCVARRHPGVQRRARHGTTTDRTVVLTVDTPGATIHYTRDGQNPTESDPSLVSGGSVVVTETQTLKAKAWAPGMASGETAIAAYTMKVATPSYSPAGGTYTSARTVTITSATSGAAIRYTTDGSTPSATSPVYTGPVTIDTTTTLKAVGLKASWSDSVAQSSTYTMNFGSLAAPAMSPTAGTYERQVSVTLTGSPGATIRYTTNGSTPTGTSPVFAAPLLIEATATVKAKAFHPDYATSGETAQAYTISVPAPVLSLASGPYNPGTHVTITSPDPAATLRISLDGSDPTATDPTLASGATLLVGTFTLKVRAFKAGCSDSAVAAATYLLTGPLGAGAVAAGGSHTALATPDGLLYAWGQNSSGQVGDSTTTGRSTPVLVQTLTGVTALAAGQNHTLAVTHDGRVFGWGANGSGQVGDDSTTNRSRPVEIAGLTNVVSVAAGNNHSLALTGDGVVYAWGSGSSGQLGLGTTATEHLPALVPGLTNVTAIAAGGSHSLAVTSTGQVYAWGANGSSQIGDDATTNRTSPTLVPGVSGVVAVAAGSLHSMARRSDGAVYVWGAGGSGQLGLGTTTVQRTPTLIPSFAPSKVVAGGTHSVGVGGYTPLVAWGANSSGQIGDTTTTLRTTPTVVAGPQSVALAAAGGSHTVAITPTGEVWTWGNGSSGQLGDGGSALRAVPIPISDPGFVWRTARPYFNVPAGTYNAPFNVVVNVVTAGAVIHYTTNGVDPTETDPVVAQGGVVSISETTTIKARAWIGGQAPSATATATYRIQVTPVAAAPVAGIYTTARIVTLTSTDFRCIYSLHYGWIDAVRGIACVRWPDRRQH